MKLDTCSLWNSLLHHSALFPIAKAEKDITKSKADALPPFSSRGGRISGHYQPDQTNWSRRKDANKNKLSQAKDHNQDMTAHHSFDNRTNYTEDINRGSGVSTRGSFRERENKTNDSDSLLLRLQNRIQLQNIIL